MRNENEIEMVLTKKEAALIALMRKMKFGTIERLSVVDGEPEALVNTAQRIDFNRDDTADLIDGLLKGIFDDAAGREDKVAELETKLAEQVATNDGLIARLEERAEVPEIASKPVASAPREKTPASK